MTIKLSIYLCFIYLLYQLHFVKILIFEFDRYTEKPAIAQFVEILFVLLLYILSELWEIFTSIICEI